jgi:hypothetical protein
VTQSEKWLTKYNEVKSFIETNHRNPSRHRIEEHQMLNWIKHTKKMIEKEGYPADRIEKFKKLMNIADKYRRVNQYQ